MNSVKPLGLYIHIPFCRQKCVYCDFYSLAGNENRMDEYTDVLCAHLAAAAPSSSKYTVDTIYFGGGTPSYLGEQRLCRILGTILDRFQIAADAEITLEANPDSVGDPVFLKKLRDAGFNRISLGMQSACAEELAEIGRIHTPEQVGAAVAAARTAGFENLSLDLIYGLPHQTMERWSENLAAAVALEPEHLSCYGLKVEEGTPLFARRETAALPGDEAQADMYLHTVEFLEQCGFAQYEISNFSKPGWESRHNLKYWTLGEYLGFGPGAHSDFSGTRFAYNRDLTAYMNGVRTHIPALSEQNEISFSERSAESLMLSLRTTSGLSPAVFEANFHCSFAPFLPFLRQCQQAGYASLDAGRWRLTPQGFLLSNQIIGVLLDTLAEQ